MYKPTDKTQTSFLDFNQPMGLNMDPNNRWMLDSISNKAAVAQPLQIKISI